MNAFCVDFPEVRHCCLRVLCRYMPKESKTDKKRSQAPVTESFRRDRSLPEESATATSSSRPETEIDATFMHVSLPVSTVMTKH
jgi:hypothetical protein